MKTQVLVLIMLVSTLMSAPALAAEPTATFALIVGVNQSVDRDQPPLHYADDDAALYFTLFRTLGARTYVLTRPDDNTRRVHPQLAAEATVPVRVSLERTVSQLSADVAQAHARRLKTILYVVYAGHGNVQSGQGYVALEDARLSGQDLAHLVDRIHPTQAHLIIDACYSFYLAYDRGPGGTRRPFAGLKRLGTLAERPEIGLLLSTSSARESHEWEGFQAGVFSHEVRSGLFGAADADGDGQVSYREIAAFIERANQAISNERFRPNTFARPPRTTNTLLDLRPALKRRVELPSGPHYVLEDSDGVRLAEVHSALGRSVALVHPMLSPQLYVRDTQTNDEVLVPPATDVVEVASLEPQPPRARERGAAHEAFGRIFALPFDAAAVESYRFRPLPDDTADERIERRHHRLRVGGWSLIGVGGGALTAGIVMSLSAASLRSDSIAGLSNLQVNARNQTIGNRNLAASILYGSAGALAVSGAVMLLVPRWQERISIVFGANGAGAFYSREF